MSAAPNRVVLIPCSAAKLSRPAPAAELYQGSYHKACRATAEFLTADGGTVLVISAKYGLVRLDWVLAPYEMTFRDPGCANGLLMRVQARQLHLDQATDVTVLASAAYVAAARTVWPHAEAPLTGLGIGQQLRRLVELRTPTGEQPEPDLVNLLAPVRAAMAPSRRPPQIHRTEPPHLLH